MNKKINKIHGDIFEHIFAKKYPIILPHVCNSYGIFGAGFVVPLVKTFPLVMERYLEWFKGKTPYGKTCYSSLGFNFALGNVQFVQVQENPVICVANMIAQNLGGKRPLRYNMLAKCMDAVGEMAIKSTWENVEIHCPSFGSGLAGGNENFIEELIKDCWLDYNIPVTMYIFP